MKYHQCRLREVNGTRQTVGWIEARGAKLGAHVELTEFGTFFEVTSVAPMTIEGDAPRDPREKHSFITFPSEPGTRFRMI